MGRTARQQARKAKGSVKGPRQVKASAQAQVSVQQPRPRKGAARPQRPQKLTKASLQRIMQLHSATRARPHGRIKGIAPRDVLMRSAAAKSKLPRADASEALTSNAITSALADSFPREMLGKPSVSGPAGTAPPALDWTESHTYLVQWHLNALIAGEYGAGGLITSQPGTNQFAKCDDYTSATLTTYSTDKVGKPGDQRNITASTVNFFANTPMAGQLTYKVVRLAAGVSAPINAASIVDTLSPDDDNVHTVALSELARDGGYSIDLPPTRPDGASYTSGSDAGDTVRGGDTSYIGRDAHALSSASSATTTYALGQFRALVWRIWVDTESIVGSEKLAVTSVWCNMSSSGCLRPLGVGSEAATTNPSANPTSRPYDPSIKAAVGAGIAQSKTFKEAVGSVHRTLASSALVALKGGAHKLVDTIAQGVTGAVPVAGPLIKVAAGFLHKLFMESDKRRVIRARLQKFLTNHGAITIELLPLHAYPWLRALRPSGKTWVRLVVAAAFVSTRTTPDQVTLAMCIVVDPGLKTLLPRFVSHDPELPERTVNKGLRLLGSDVFDDEKVEPFEEIKEP